MMTEMSPAQNTLMHYVLAAKAALEPVERWVGRDREAAMELVLSGVLGKHAHVIRGLCDGVPGEHYWVALAEHDISRPEFIIDPTFWAHQSPPAGPVRDVLGVWGDSVEAQAWKAEGLIFNA